ncbi:SDR family NAD(P)-dependent oxidoreductase [Paracoccaceae bacterium GXU_MW_L88]
MTKTALITGASSGIGMALARHHAERRGDLILVARREDRLEALKKELMDAHTVDVYTIAMDLAEPGAAEKLLAEVEARGLTVDYLINNAGFGGIAGFTDKPLEEWQGMIDLNISSLTAMCHTFLPHLVANGGGKVLNVSSVAGFMPGPYQAVYFASKAYVQSFSQSLAGEFADKGVTVTALCPGPVKTEFGDVAGYSSKGFIKLALDPEEVARQGYLGMLDGDLVTWDSLRWRLYQTFVRPFMPRRMEVEMIKQDHLKSL